MWHRICRFFVIGVAALCLSQLTSLAFASDIATIDFIDKNGSTSRYDTSVYTDSQPYWSYIDSYFGEVKVRLNGGSSSLYPNVYFSDSYTYGHISVTPTSSGSLQFEDIGTNYNFSTGGNSWDIFTSSVAIAP